MKMSLGLVLGLCLAGLQFIAILVVVSSSYLTSERVLLNHARDLLSDVGGNAIAHSQGFLDPAQGAAELAARLAESEVVSSDNKALLERLLFQQLQITPQFAGVFYGDQQGNFVYVMRSEGIGPFRSKIISRETDNLEVELIWREDDYGVVTQFFDPQDQFDPRTRPWYQGAATQEGTVWTDPYVFFSSQTPGITIAAPVIGKDGLLQGVIGVDIEIAAISDFLSDLQIGDSGSALIINRNGDVIAHPEPDLLIKKNADGTTGFVGIDEIDDPMAREAFGALADMEFVSVAEETNAGFNFRGADFVSTVMPIMSEELPWTIAVYAPVADFTSAIVANRTRDIWIAALVATITGVIGLILANYINRPVRAFAVRAALVSQGEVDPSSPMPKTYRELERANETLNEEILQRKKSEREYGQTFNLSLRGMVQVTPDTGRFIRVNAKFAELVGYSMDEILGMTVNDLTHPGDVSALAQLLDDTEGEAGASVEKRCLRKDGEIIWVNANAIMIRDNDGKPLHAVMTVDDMTQRKDAEDQINKLNRDLSHMARGELLGQMAAGLAHELNQPLTAITQNADTALMTAKENASQDAELVEILNELDQQAHRAADIVKALRGFARKGEEWKSPLDLAELIDQSLRLIKAEATEHDVRIDVTAQDLPMVNGIRVQIAQVIVNLLRNAIESIADSGDNRKEIGLNVTVEGEFVKVAVEDTGPGVDPDIDLFTQFETTKADGMGLGLSICRTIIETGGGRMWHDPTDGTGARFCFTVPVVS